MARTQVYVLSAGLLSSLPLTVAQANVNTVQDITNKTFNKTRANCGDYVGQYEATAQDVRLQRRQVATLTITADQDSCTFQSNAIPNHDFNDGKRAFPNQVKPQQQEYQVTRHPRIAPKPSPLSLRSDNAVMLNGVKVDVLAAGCFGIADGKIGCFDMNQKWRYDPAFRYSDFLTDSHHAHAQPDGTYHYHASPNALFSDSRLRVSPVIGFAADGFPILGPYLSDNGIIRPAKSSYQLKQGNRPTGNNNPGGTYDGTYRDDYVFVEGSGDLDQCNGMTIHKQYGYYVTNSFPYILNCFKGTPDPSFNKAAAGHHAHQPPPHRGGKHRRPPPPPSY